MSMHTHFYILHIYARTHANARTHTLADLKGLLFNAGGFVAVVGGRRRRL